MKITTSVGIIVIAVAAVLMQRVLFPAEAETVVAPPKPVVVQPPSSSLKGKIVSVEEQSSNQSKPGLRRAMVKLDSGETVQAWVPTACVVFPGYVTRLVKSVDRAGASYMVAGTE